MYMSLDYRANKIAVVSHDYNLFNSYGHQDFAEHYSQIVNTCDRNGCNTILFSLYSWDENSPVIRNKDTIYTKLRNVKCVILEVGGRKSIRWFTEVWFKGEDQPRSLVQYFAKSNDPDILKRDFIRNAHKRIFGNCMVVICGESNIASRTKDGRFNDFFGFNDILKSRGVQYILNPIHDYMTRPEMKKKRCYYSLQGRAVVSVWNKGKRKGESPTPWTFFFDGEDLTKQVREISTNFPSRPDIRIGIIPEVF